MQESFRLDLGIDDAGLQQLSQWVAAAALSASSLPSPPALLAKDTELRVVFITLADDNGHHTVASGLGMGIVAATQRAFKFAHSRCSHTITRTKVDLMAEVVPLPAERVRNHQPLVADRSLVGVMIDKMEQGWLPEESFRYNLVDRQGRLNYRAIKGHLAERISKPDSDKVWLFSARSRYADNVQNTLLFRGHEFQPRLSQSRALDVARNGAAYLARQTAPGGRMHYEYDALTDNTSDDYNILRHAGSLWSMLLVQKDAPTVELHRKSLAACEYLLQQIRPFSSQHPDLLVVTEKNHAKLGGNGLALVALSAAYKVQGTTDLLPTMQGLARWICATQAADGRFTMHKVRLNPLETRSFVSGYYPGEAILGLVSLYKIDRDHRWLDAADRAARWLINVRDAGKPVDSLERDHWLLYALNELHRLQPRPLFLAHTRRLLASITHAQHTKHAMPDYVGGFQEPLNGGSTACMCEGMAAGYALLRDYGGPDNAEELASLRKAMEAGLSVLLQMQLTRMHTMYLPNPARAHGGFYSSLNNRTLRIDNTQHALTAFINYARLFG
ncbi:hypothetical protein ACR0ST_01995 [Aliidiomarina sp. Khilg15.8]